MGTINEKGHCDATMGPPAPPVAALAAPAAIMPAYPLCTRGAEPLEGPASAAAGTRGAGGGTSLPGAPHWDPSEAAAGAGACAAPEDAAAWWW